MNKTIYLYALATDGNNEPEYWDTAYPFSKFQNLMNSFFEDEKECWHFYNVHSALYPNYLMHVQKFKITIESEEV